jgi:hypothetical protein
MSRVFKALSNRACRRVLQLLSDGTMSAGALSDQLSVSKPMNNGYGLALRVRARAA